MNKHLVIVGGGHAHLTTMRHLRGYVEDGHAVTVISASDYHYYSGMGPGMLSGIYRPEDIRFHIKKMVEDRGGMFLEDRVVRIDPIRRMLFLHSGHEIGYDVVSFNVGSDISAPFEFLPGEKLFPVKPIINLLNGRRRILDDIAKGTPRIVVVGGGPAGVEITGNIWRLVRDHSRSAEIRLLAGNRLLKGVPDRVRLLALKSLRGRGISILEGRRVIRIDKESLVLDDNSGLPFDILFLATGVRPPTLFRNSGLPVGPEGGLQVNEFLQSTAHPVIFGGGDCISLEGLSLAKVGVYAVRQNLILRHNLRAALKEGTLMPFLPQRRFLLIFNMGDGRGIFWRGDVVWSGRLAFWLKDYIDRKFMRTFQVSGERQE